METSEQLLARIEAAASAEGVAATTFTQKHFKNSKMIDRLRSGGFVNRKTYQRLIELIGPPPQAAA